MLTQFTIKRKFYKLAATLYVDLEGKNASLTVTYDRRIVALPEIHIYDVNTVEKAEKWLSRPVDERGNFIEVLEHQYRLLAA